MNGGPPTDWLERVKAGAPELLLPPEEGGPPRIVTGQSETFPVRSDSHTRGATPRAQVRDLTIVTL